MQTIMQAAASRDTSNGTGVRLDVRLCASWSEVELFRAQWNALLPDVADASTFLTPEWLASWWQAYGCDKKLRALLFFTPDGDLVGLAPLYLEQRKMFGCRVNILRLVGDGSGDSDGLDFIIRTGFEQDCLSSFFAWLPDSEWDSCSFATMPDSSVFGTLLLQNLRAGQWSVIEQRTPGLRISFPTSWNSYLAALKPDFRPLLTRYPRRLKNQHDVRFYRATLADVESNLLKLFSLHEMRWRERGQAGVFVSAERRHFYRELSVALLERGWLEFWLMDLDGTTVAAQFCFRLNDTVYLLQEGFDPRYTDKKVGYALRAEMFQDLIRRGVREYDFLAGRDSHKLRFGGQESSYITVSFARPATRGGAYLALRRLDSCVRHRARQMFPESALRLARVIFSKLNRG